MKYDAEVASAIARVNPNIDPALVHAIIQKESSHGAALVTPETRGRYSYGPMMVLDSTARGLGVADPSSLARDPAAGIYYGTRYLNSKLQAYPGDTASAVAAYNAGTARRGASGAFINQDYVNKVLGFWRQYRGAAPAAAGAGALIVLLVGGYLFLRSRRRARAA